ncbi:hypothetical protein [Halobacteriovorax sp. CON-3]|uniref:hypothetical protein n=1 Tax=Halobacteriovorax sp. CON-3 TaxID=3157710 RepID=UPI00371929CF
MKKIILYFVIFGQSAFANTNYIGRYELEVNIGGKFFKDYFTVSNISASKKVTGIFEVPRVFQSSFTGQLNDRFVSGDFIAKERGKEFKVKLLAEFLGQCQIKGALLQDKIVFANFVGRKDSCHE